LQRTRAILFRRTIIISITLPPRSGGSWLLLLFRDDDHCVWASTHGPHTCLAASQSMTEPFVKGWRRSVTSRNQF
jgi:hypothetical protein